MRLLRARLLPLLTPALAACAALLVACGGPAFTAAPADAGAVSPSSTGDGAPSASASFCAADAGAHTFCDDFDGLPLSSKWDSVDQGAGGTAVTDSTTSYSAPSSFKSIAPASVGIETRGRVVKSFGKASRVVIAFEMFLDATPVKLAAGAIGGDNVVAIAFGAAYSIGIDAHTDEIAYFEDAIGDGGVAQQLTGKNLVATPMITGWTAVEIAIDLTKATVSISLGGVTRVTNAAITPPSGQSVSVYLGAFAHNQTQELAVHYDNCTIDITP
jgi:hypothetical protein